MRLYSMTRLASLALAAAVILVVPAAVHAQNAVGGQGSTFKDTSMLKLPAGAHVAILDFDDLECPSCAHAFPITHTAIEHYKIPLIHHDFPLQMHKWSRDAAVTARYLLDKVSPDVSEEFRRDVFASQNSISSKDDLDQFTRKWFTTHKLQMPFVTDPTGRFAAEVQADYTLGERLGVQQTPTIIVLRPHGWTQVMDVTQLYSVIDAALAETPAKLTPAAHAAAHKSTKN